MRQAQKKTNKSLKTLKVKLWQDQKINKIMTPILDGNRKNLLELVSKI